MSFIRFVAALGVAIGLNAAAVAQTVPNLTIADVDKVVGQALAEAAARNATNGAIAVVDRVGNVLGVYALNPGNIPLMTITSGRGIPLNNGLEAVNILPATFGALAKAITGAYLSSSGNAFTTRTASQIVQEHFNPGERNTPSGPLFGVQFSQLACSDLTRFGETIGGGPRRSPLGLSADLGGLPLYKNGQVVGGVGVLFDGVYGLDLKIDDYDRDLDELIAVAAQQGFEPPTDITSRITADGKFLTYTDVDRRDLKTTTAAAVNPTNYIAVAGYTPAGRRDGVAFGTPTSGVRDEGSVDYPAVDAWILDDGLGNNRYAPRAGLAPAAAAGGLATAEVRTIVTEALKVAFKSRAQIRRPLGSFVQVTVSVVDTEANILAVARTPDAPVFGTDVSLQKARSAVFMSRPTTAAELRAVPAVTLIPGTLSTVALGTYVDAFQALVGPTALSDGKAFADRSVGLLARPFYPDGIEKYANGPLSKPFNVWSPFNVGLQLDLVLGDIVARLDGSAPPPQGCTSLPQSAAAGPGPAPTRLANGLQIFPGSVPVYRGNTLIGGLGVSGDGIDQDDMVSFLGLHNAGLALNSGVGNAPKSLRADTLKVGGLALRYVQCPFSPFTNSTEQNVCSGK
ncbi:MAG: heme-binding protein [Rhodospirillaceae bacterium]|nr:heme-binding protein [Rhodospirillaceae bacterium]